MSTTTPKPYVLFGLGKPFTPPPWTTTDDRLRGGASHSHLSALPHNRARFHGHLDTSTLGGAGFASQFSPSPPTTPLLQFSQRHVDGSQEGGGGGSADGGEGSWWDLSAYDGIEVLVEKGDEDGDDGKVYTFIVKDEEAPGKREEGDGREKAGISWEVDFRVRNKEEEEEGEGGDGEKEGAVDGGIRIWLPWHDFKATYRGKEKDDAGELKKGQVRRVGFMMRSYFGKQSGDFSLVLRSVCAKTAPPAREDEEKRKVRNTAMGGSSGIISDTQNADTGCDHDGGKESGKGRGWLGWFSGFFTVS